MNIFQQTEPVAQLQDTVHVLQKLHGGLKQAHAVREKMAAAPPPQPVSAGQPSSTETSAAVLPGIINQGNLERQGSLPEQSQLAEQRVISKAISMPANHANLLRAYASDNCHSQCSPKAHRSPHSPQRHVLGMLMFTEIIIAAACMWSITFCGTAGEIANANESAEMQHQPKSKPFNVLSTLGGRIDNRTAVKDSSKVNRAAWI